MRKYFAIKINLIKVELQKNIWRHWLTFSQAETPAQQLDELGNYFWSLENFKKNE